MPSERRDDVALAPINPMALVQKAAMLGELLAMEDEGAAE